MACCANRACTSTAKRLTGVIHSLEFPIVLGAAFIAGCIDAIAGGGGLIQLPALFSAYPRVDPTTLLGTNKVASVFGTANSAWRYSRHIELDWRSLLPLMGLVLVCSGLGATLAMHVPPSHYRLMVPILLGAVLIVVLRNRNLGMEKQERLVSTRERSLAAIIIAVTGFYDGFFGPGTGSFFMFIFIRFFGYDFIHAAAYARVLNVMTNIAAIILFARSTQIMWGLAIAMAVSNIAGSILGTNVALRQGNVFVRKVFVVLVIALVIKTAWNAIY